MIDHFNIPVRDVAKARAFYDAALGVLGYAVIAEDGPAVGYGADAWRFGLVPSEGYIQPLHLAFAAPSFKAVEAFYAAALKAGGRSNGPPGERPEYGANYYAAYVLDLDGHNIEAVFRG